MERRASRWPLFAIGATAICAAKTFVYVSNAQDGNIDAYTLDLSTGSLTPIGKAEAGKLVMPMAVSPNQKHLYAVTRSQPPHVLTYASDPATGVLTQIADCLRDLSAELGFRPIDGLVERAIYREFFVRPDCP